MKQYTNTFIVEHEQISKILNAKIYFCQPYKSYQKGAIENGNRLLRKLFPSDRDISKLSQLDIDDHVNKINQRPMKCLKYKTPAEVFYRIQTNSR